MLNQNQQLKSDMPLDLVFIRHGESESNFVQQLERAGEKHPQFDQIATRSDWKQRLTEEGVRQAKRAGQYLTDEMGGLESFDACFVSPFLRARETAAYLGEGEWVIDDRIVERFLGVRGVETFEQDQLAKLLEIRSISPWYSRPEWGESLQDVFNRYSLFEQFLRNNYSGERVLVVSHSDFIKTARYGIEWLLPEQWEDAEFDQDQKLPNCAILHYSRVNPYNPTEVSTELSWVRVIDPNDLSNDQPWRQIEIKSSYTNQELLESTHLVETIL